MGSSPTKFQDYLTSVGYPIPARRFSGAVTNFPLYNAASILDYKQQKIVDVQSKIGEVHETLMQKKNMLSQIVETGKL